MTNLIACYQLIRCDETFGQRSYPTELTFWSHDDGKVRFHKRGAFHNIDKWFASFDDALSTIEKVATHHLYKLRTINPRGYKLPLFDPKFDQPTPINQDAIACPF